MAILGFTLTSSYDYLVFKERILKVILLSQKTLIILLLQKNLVEPSGIEPLTSCVQSRRSPS